MQWKDVLAPKDISPKEAGEVEEEWRRCRKAKLLADHNLPAEVVRYLRSRGAKVITAAEIGVDDQGDDRLVKEARRRQCIIVTQDRDFLDDHRHPLMRLPGTVVLDLGNRSRQDVVKACAQMRILLRCPAFYATGVRIHAHPHEWIEETRYRDGSTGRSRFRFHLGRVQEWVEAP